MWLNIGSQWGWRGTRTGSGWDQDEPRGEGDGGVESGLSVQDGSLWDLCLIWTRAGWAQNWNRTIGIQTRWKQNQDWIGQGRLLDVTRVSFSGSGGRMEWKCDETGSTVNEQKVLIVLFFSSMDVRWQIFSRLQTPTHLSRRHDTTRSRSFQIFFAL